MAVQLANALQLKELSLTSNVCTCVCEAPFFRGKLVPGATLVFQNVAVNTFLNNQAVTLTSATQTTQSGGRGSRYTLVFPFTNSNVLIGGDSGDIQVSAAIADPGGRPVNDAQFPAWCVKDRQYKESLSQVPSDGGKGLSNS
jgi:hypothetical protein